MSLTDDEILSVMFRCETLGQTYAQVALTLGMTRSGVAGIVKRTRDAAPQVEAARLRDHEVKALLDGLFTRRATAEVLAKEFARKGRALNRQAVLYQVWRVMNDLAAAGPDLAEVTGNLDRVDWPHWWRAVDQRGIAA